MINPFRKLVKVYKDLPIKRKMLFLFNIQIIVPLALVGFMSYRIASDILREKSIEYSRDILRTIELRLKDCVNNLNYLSQDLLYDNKIYDGLKGNNLSYNPLYAYDNESEIKNTLRKFIFSRNEIQSVCFVSKNENVKYFYDNNSRKDSIIDLIDYKKMSSKAAEGHGKVTWYFQYKDGNVKNIFLVRTIYDRDNYKDEVGLLIFLVKREIFESVYQGLTEDMQNIVIVSKENDLIVSRYLDNGYLLDKNTQGEFAGKSKWILDSENNSLISYVSMSEPDWKIVTYISLKKLYKQISDLRLWIIWFCLLSVLVLSVISRTIALDLTNPIVRLAEGMKKVQKGGPVDVKVDRNDELGFITTNFNEMAKEIEHLITWIYGEQITRKEAQLKALQAQINPHFLFNTLESINWMAHLNNVPEISETVSALSSMMEASIGRDDKLISLGEEFIYIDNYISILKNRYEDSIQLVKNIESEEILMFKIPRLLIQPLIENAVYHGIEKSLKTGIINLNAFVRDDNIIIEVIDNGLGIDGEELDRLNENLSMDNDKYFRNRVDDKGKSIGIENVNRRIKLFYGENYGLKIKSEKDEFTKVIVTMPLKKKNEDNK